MQKLGARQAYLPDSGFELELDLATTNFARSVKCKQNTSILPKRNRDDATKDFLEYFLKSKVVSKMREMSSFPKWSKIFTNILFVRGRARVRLRLFGCRNGEILEETKRTFFYLCKLHVNGK